MAGIHNQAHEKLVQDLLLDLSSLEIGRFWKNPRGVAHTARGQFMTFGVPGQADISGILLGGWRAEIEVKTGTGRLSKEQINFLNMIQKWGGFAYEARNLFLTREAIFHFLEMKKKAGD